MPFALVLALLSGPVAADVPACDDATVGALVLDLFPPASEGRRVQAARQLAQCRAERASGALASALAADRDPEVRLEAARALGVLPTEVAREALAEQLAQPRAPAALRAEVMRSLVRQQVLEPVRERLADAHENDDVRAQALMLLEKTGEMLPAAELARLANVRPGGLSAMASAMFVQRRAAEAEQAARARAEATRAVEQTALAARQEQDRAAAQRLDEEREAREEREAHARAESVRAELLASEPAPVESISPPPAEKELASRQPVLESVEPAPADPPEELRSAPSIEPIEPIAPRSMMPPVAEAAIHPPILPVDVVLVPPAPPADGRALVIGTSMVAGGTLMPFLVLTSEQQSLPYLLGAGTVGVAIGGFTSGVLWRHPTAAQAAWYTNATAWGALAGLTVSAGSGLGGEKGRWLSLGIGETVGVGVGIWSATRYDWTPQMMVLADSLLVGTGLADAGVRGLAGLPLGPSPVAAIGVVPAMIASTLAARALDPSTADLHLLGNGAVLAGFNGMLLSSGGFGASPLTDGRARGGLMAGLGVGYVAAITAGAFTEVDPDRTWHATAASMAGNLLGLGAHMALSPAHSEKWALGAGLGGVGLASAAFAYYPRLKPGPEALPMTFAGALYGGGTWWAAQRAARGGPASNDLDRNRQWGGMLAGATGGAIAGLVASKYARPTAEDEWTTAAATALGMSGGLGVARLAASGPGRADAVGVLSGAALGFASGAVASHLTELRGPDVGAGFAGLGYGAFLGALAPALRQASWDASDRTSSGGALLGLAVGAAAATVAAHETEAKGGQVAVPTVAGLFGLGMGAGAGLLFPDDGSHALRVGAFAGPLALGAGALVADRWLELSKGLGPSATPLGFAGAAYGAAEGLFLAQLAAPGGQHAQLTERLVGGGLLLGASAGAATGLAFSRFRDPPPTAYATAGFASFLGGAMGEGVSHLAVGTETQADPAAVLVGSMGGLVAGAMLSRTPWSGADVGAGVAGAAAGSFVGTLVPSLGAREWEGGRAGEGGALTGLALGTAGAMAASHLTGATGGQVGLATVAGGLGALAGTGIGMAWPVAHLGLLDEPVYTTQPERIGATIGTLGVAAIALAADRRLELSKGLGDGAAGMAAAGAVAGGYYGYQLAAALGTGLSETTPGDKLGGGVLFGVATGVGAGLALSKRYDPDGGAYELAGASSLAGAMFGAGVSLLVQGQRGRAETIGLTAGGLGALWAGAMAAHDVHLTAADRTAAGFGGAYGVLAGGLLPSLASPSWQNDPRTDGGLLVGTSAAAVLAVTASHLAGADVAQVNTAGVGALLGLGAGFGTGLVLPDFQTASGEPDTRGLRIATLAGPTLLGAAALAADHRWHFSQGLGPSAGELTLLGAGIGGFWGTLGASAVAPDGQYGTLSTTQAFGGLLAGTSLGVAAGLAASKFATLEPGDEWAGVAAPLLGAGLGLGAALAATREPNRAEPRLALTGSAGALALAAWTQHASPLEPADWLALPLGVSTGLLLGSLAPTLGHEDFPGFDRHTSGFALAGASGGALAAMAARHLTGASAASVGMASVGGLDGALVGLGLGLVIDPDHSRAGRIAVTAGTSLGMAAVLAADHRWHFSEGLGPDAGEFALLGVGRGAAWGALAAAAVAKDGQWSSLEAPQQAGGILAGASLGLVAGLATSKFHTLAPGDDWAAVVGPALGAGLGMGAAMAATSTPSRAEPLLALTGSVGALALTAWTQRVSPLEAADWEALPLGLSSGLLLGSLAPTLRQLDWPGYDRNTGGWALASASGGALAAMALRHVTGAEASTVGLASLGGLDGALTGIGFGLLLDPDHSHAGRVAVTAATSAGLVLGAAVWPRVHLDAADVPFLAAATGVGAWTGYWLPSARAGELSDVSSRQRGGGFLAGFGVASFAASLAAPWAKTHPDLVADALALDVLWSGAGLGAGLLGGRTDGHAVSGMLIGGAAGLLLGGALHDQLDVGPEDAGLLTLAAAEGAWFGGWLPHALFAEAGVTSRRQVGGLLAGTLGALGGAALATRVAHADGTELGLSATGSLVGASMAGGIALVSPALGGRASVGTMLGGSALGLVSGALLAKKLDLGVNAIPKALIGATLGASEGLAFAWAGKATTGEQWGGAALFGGGTGALLGLAAAAYPHFRTSQLPPALGCAAWGAWVGSFAGGVAGGDRRYVIATGVIGANAGFAAGYGLLRAGLIEPTDLGWLSVFGALGMVAGAGIGAPFSTKDDPRPIFAGLALGPVVGMVAGGLLLPKLKQLGDGGDVAAELDVPHLAAAGEP